MAKKKTPAPAISPSLSQSIASSIMAQWGRLGGPARAKALSPERRREIARLAAAASTVARRRKARARRRAEAKTARTAAR